MSDAVPYPELPWETGADIKESYPMQCALCGHEQRAQASIMMTTFGVNTGSGSCLNCHEYLHLYIAADNSKIISEGWADYLQRMKDLGILK